MTNGTNERRDVEGPLPEGGAEQEQQDQHGAAAAPTPADTDRGDAAPADPAGQGAAAAGGDGSADTEELRDSEGANGEAPHDPADADHANAGEVRAAANDGADASRNAVANHEDDGPTMQVGAGQPDRMAVLLEEAYYRSTTDLLGKVEQQRDLGLHWLRAKATTIPDSGLTVEQWVAMHLTFSHQHANACGRLAKDYDKFSPAHDWYRQTGVALGYRTKKNSGYDYAFAVIALHRKWRRGEPPDPIEKKQARSGPPARQRIADVERERDMAVEELARVVRYYRATPQGEGFESPVLTSLKCDVASTADEGDVASDNGRGRQGDTGMPRYADWLAARAGTEGDRASDPQGRLDLPTMAASRRPRKPSRKLPAESQLSAGRDLARPADHLHARGSETVHGPPQ